jgi:hypothetical protein
VDVTGLYVAYDGTGALVRCDEPDKILYVNDSALAATYRHEATQPYQRMFVRLRGVRADSGSIYGGAHYFLVQRVLELRARRAGECPNLTTPVPLLSRATP